MRIELTERWSRREFLAGLSLAGTAGLLGLGPRPGAAEPPPETTTIRLGQGKGTICLAPNFMAEEFLRAEGFTDIQYIKLEGWGGYAKLLASGEAHIGMGATTNRIMGIDTGKAVVLLAGVHVGCYELFGTDAVRTIRDLKGKTIAGAPLGSGAYTFLASMLAYVGLDPRKDINWVEHPPDESMRLLSERKIDAFMGYPPEIAQEVRAKKIGHVMVNTMMERPWSQYFCCVVIGNREFVRKHPVATKRALRAMLKGADLCAREPERVARFLVEQGYTQHYDYALQAMKEIPYDKWREYDHEDTVRFFALRLHEIGMIKSTPQKIIKQGTDWRFLNELKKEWKG